MPAPDMPPPTTTPEQQRWITEVWASPMFTRFAELALDELPDSEAWVVGMVVGSHIMWPNTRPDGTVVLPPFDVLRSEVRRAAVELEAAAAARGMEWPLPVHPPLVDHHQPTSPNRATRRAARHGRHR